MTHFDSEYFQRIKFTSDKISQFITSAARDVAIAMGSAVPEVVFKFSYDALIKVGIALIASKGYKVRSRVGHHVRIM